MGNIISNENQPLKLAVGEIVWLKSDAFKGNLRYISLNANIVSVLQNGKIIANSTGFALVEVYCDAQKIADIYCEVFPGKTAYPVLFNRYNKVFYPSDELVLIDNNYTVNKRQIYIAKKVLKAFYQLCNDAKSENILIFASQGYRKFSDQLSIIKKFTEEEGIEKAMKRCAPAGFSEHHTGLSLDVCGGRIADGEFIKDNDVVYKWIGENCFKYGFMIKNPPDKEHITGTIYEPWHIRFIGRKRIANFVHKENITLDEYFDNHISVSCEVDIDNISE